MIRLAIVLTLLLAVALAWQGPGILRTRRPRLMFARGVLAVFAFTTYYIALSSIPLAVRQFRGQYTYSRLAVGHHYCDSPHPA